MNHSNQFKRHTKDLLKKYLNTNIMPEAIICSIIVKKLIGLEDDTSAWITSRAEGFASITELFVGIEDVIRKKITHHCSH